MWLYTDKLKISWLEPVTSHSTSELQSLGLRLFFYFKGVKNEYRKNQTIK